MNTNFLRIYIFLFLTLFTGMEVVSQTDTLHSQQPYKGRFFCEETKISLYLDLYEESLEAPDLAFLGKVNGYLSGRGVYGTWLVTGFEINNEEAVIRLSDDAGSSSQTILFRPLSDKLYEYTARGSNNVKKAKGRRLVDVPSKMIFRRW